VLTQRATSSRRARYLIEVKPVHVVVSTTVYDGLRRPSNGRTERDAPATLVAFGDPSYPPASASPMLAPVALELTKRGLSLTPLPATRREVSSIAPLFPGSSRVFRGAAATVYHAKTAAADARYLHFAVHGFVDERFPLNSALALSMPAKPGDGVENGLLQVWEIFEQLRLNADIVTLSACQTALGQELGGEGLLGLTRAFHFAGAQSVAASLWSIADDSTAALMTRFYRHLSAGQSKDEALRAAQLELLRGSKFAHPFHWAAFQLFGDWR
jgi:CHAT domain-containing protein